MGKDHRMTPTVADLLDGLASAEDSARYWKARAEKAEAAVAEVLRRCDIRELENPMNEPGRHEVPTWILVADVRNALAGPTTG